MAVMKAGGTGRMDMLNGSLWDKLIKFAVPLAMSMILQQFFNSADVAVVGRFDSSRAMAAVGSNGALINLMIGLFVGLSVGTNVLIANCIGADDGDRVHKAVHTSMTIALISGLFLAAAGSFLSRPLLAMLSTPADVIDLAETYLRIYFLGAPFIMVYNFGAAILRSSGDSRRPFWCLFCGGVINVLLNLVLVIVFKMGVRGVGIATVISNVISSCMVTRFVMNEDGYLRFRPREMRIHMQSFMQMIRIGVPAGIQGMVFSLSNACVLSGINSFGADASAGSAAALNFEIYAWFIINAFSQAAMTFTSQNFGAGNFERCRRVFALSMTFSVLFTGIVCAVFAYWRSPLMRFYTIDEAVTHYAMIRLMRVGVLEPVISTYEVPGAAMRGMGWSMTPTVISVLGSCVLRAAWVLFVFPYFRSFETLMNVYLISWILMGTATTIMYFRAAKATFAGQISV